MCRLHHAAAALLFLARGAAPSAWAGDQPQWGQQYSRNMVSEERGLPVGLALLFIAFAGARRGLGNACSRLLGRNSLPRKEAA